MKALVPFPEVVAPPPITLDVFDGGAATPDLDNEIYVLPLTFDPAPLDLIGRLPRLRHVMTLTAGHEHLAGLIPAGVTLSGAGPIHATSVSELAVALTLASIVGLPGHLDAQRESLWAHAPRQSLADRRVLVVGAGAIGDAVKRRLEIFECSVACVSRSTTPSVNDLPRLVSSHDVVILAVPLTDETRGLFDRALLSAMPDGALLVNVSRGGVVVTEDLVNELDSGRLKAALDVVDPEPLPADHPLWRCDGLILTPHVGGPSTAFRPRAVRHIEEQLRRIAEGNSPRYVLAV